MAALLYTASTAICTPNSLSQEVGLGLGAQAGEARLREVFEEAGFTSLPPGGRDADEPDPRGPPLARAFRRGQTTFDPVTVPASPRPHERPPARRGSAALSHHPN